MCPTPVARVSTSPGRDAQDEGENRDGACMRGEMSFPARGNLRLVAIGGSKLAREAVGARVAPTKGAKGRDGERARGEARSCANTARGCERGKCAVGERRAEEERDRPGVRRARGETDGRPV